MTDRSQFLERQLNLYKAQAEEGWKLAHEAAMACRRVEDVIAHGLFVLGRIKALNAEWDADLRRGEAEFSWEVAEQIASLYREWQVNSRVALQAIQACEQRGYHVEDAEEFRAALHEVAMLPLDVERTRKSIEALEQGRGITFDQAMHELRTRVRPESL